VFKIYRKKGYNYVNLVLIADDTSVQFIEILRSYPEWGYRIIMIFSNSGVINEKYRGIIKILPDRLKEELHELLEEYSIDEILYLRNQVNPSEIRQTIRICEELGIIFRLQTNDRQPKLTNAFVSTLADEKFLTFINIPHKSFDITVKKMLDIIISGFLLILLSPLIGLADFKRTYNLQADKSRTKGASVRSLQVQDNDC
jgi:hypothetical protein